MKKILWIGISILILLFIVGSILFIINQGRQLNEQVKVDVLKSRISKCDCQTFMSGLYNTEHGQATADYIKEQWNKNQFCSYYCGTGKIDESLSGEEQK